MGTQSVYLVYMICTQEACQCRHPAVKNCYAAYCDRGPYMQYLGRILTRTLACKSWETALTYYVKARCLYLQVTCREMHHILLTFILTHACKTLDRSFKRIMDLITCQSAPTWSNRSTGLQARQTALNALWPNFFISFETLGQGH